MTAEVPPTDEQQLLAEVAARLGVPTGGGRVLHRHSNLIVAFPEAGLLVRIAAKPEACDRITRSIRVTRWLAGRGFPCTPPKPIEQPIDIDGRIVTVWDLLDLIEMPKPGGADLGRLLRRLHELSPPGGLAEFTRPMSGTLRAVQTTTAELGADGEWLTDRIGALDSAWDRLDFALPKTLIHGDAHTNNLMQTRDGTVVLGDWDHTAIGQPEWDLCQIHYFARRFGYPREQLTAFTTAYGWDVRHWPGLDTLIAVREISGLSPYIRQAADSRFHRDELAYRLETLRAENTDARWRSPSEQPR
jgi:hypothetical protein